MLNLISLLFAIVALELFLGFAGLGESEIVRLDKKTGFAPFENKHITWRKEGFARTSYNSLGMNDIERPLEKPLGVTRIAVIGDSLTEAIQVDRSNNFCSLIQKQLDEKAPGKYEVINCAASAFNAGQVWLRMKDHVFPFHPDLVLYAVRTDATGALVPFPAGGITCCRPDFDLDKDGKLIVDYKNQEGWLNSPNGKRYQTIEWLRKNSHLYSVIGSMYADWTGWWGRTTGRWQRGIEKALHRKLFADPATGADQLRAQAAILEATDETQNNKRWLPVLESIISKMHSECEEQGCKFAVVRIPMFTSSPNRQEQKAITEVTAREHIPYLDLTDVFYGLPKPSARGFFYVVHLTPEGHQVIADKLAPFVRGLQ